MNKQEAAKVIALALAEKDGHSVPTTPDWAEAKYLTDLLEERGHIKPEVEQEELTVYGYTVVMRDGTPVEDFGLLTQQDAIDRAASMTRDAAESGIDWDYRIAAIVDQGGL